MRQTAQNAQGHWPGILSALGIDSGYLRNVHGPCPMCGGDKSSERWRFDDKLNGRWICSRCGSGDGFQLLQKLHGWDFAKAANEVDRILGSSPAPHTPRKNNKTDEERREEKRKRDLAYGSRIFRAALPITEGDPAWKYLTRRCGNVAGLIGDLRFYPELDHPYDRSVWPTLLARMVKEVGGRAVGVQRIYLTEDGHKAPVSPAKLTLAETGFVQLGPVTEVMGIAEGIETALCAQQRFGVPVWAAISANGMSKWRPPAGCKSVIVCADNDASFTGQAAAYGLARELVRQGIDARVELPPRVGTDWANVFMEGAA